MLKTSSTAGRKGERERERERETFPSTRSIVSFIEDSVTDAGNGRSPWDNFKDESSWGRRNHSRPGRRGIRKVQVIHRPVSPQCLGI